MNSQGGSLRYNGGILRCSNNWPNRGRPGDKGCYIHGQFHSPTFTAHHVHNYFLETFPCARPTWAETIMLIDRIRSLRIEIDQLMRMCSQRWPRKICKKLYKNTSPMKWKYISSLNWRRQAFTPNDFQMHQQSLDHSYCKQETSLTKLSPSSRRNSSQNLTMFNWK
jgi:hypothetical protein